MPNFIQNGQRSMFHRNEAPCPKLDIGKGLLRTAEVNSDLPYPIQDNQSLLTISESNSELPEFIQNGRSSTTRGNEAPSAKLDIDQSLLRIAKVYSELPRFIQNSRSLFTLTEVYSILPMFIQNTQSTMCGGNDAPNAKLNIIRSLFRFTISHSG